MKLPTETLTMVLDGDDSFLFGMNAVRGFP